MMITKSYEANHQLNNYTKVSTFPNFEQICQAINQIDLPKVLITDHTVKKLYQSYLDTLTNVLVLSFTPKERFKSFTVYQQILKALIKHQIPRNAVIIALGGGTVTDCGGMVASTYKRGIKLINIPTTLMAMIDASIGGKCGLNFQKTKNQIGTFKFASDIWITTQFLTTLPRRQFQSGLVEIIKNSILFDFDIISELKQMDLNTIIAKNIDLKLKIVELDYYDQGERQKLNFGHTIGHAVESYYNYRITHGEAVGYGMYYEANQAIRAKLLKIYQALNLKKVLTLINQKIDFSDLVTNIANDKKMTTIVDNNQPNSPLITYIEVITPGQIKLTKLSLSQLERIYNE